MKLFDRAERNEMRGRLWGESIYAYLNGSNRKSITAIRGLLEGWFAEFPEGAKKDLCARFRSPEDETHLAAFFELYMHKLLTCMGLRLKVHPTLERGTGTRPDFLILDEEGRGRCFLECTTAALSREMIAGNKRVAALLDVINKLDSLNFHLDITLEGIPKSPAPAAKLRKKLEKWLAGLDPDELAKIVKSKGFEAMPQYEWEHNGLVLKIMPIPKSPENRGKKDGTPVIGALMPESMSVVTCATDFKKALMAKADHYGHLELPFIIAVNNIGGQFGRHDHNMEALFGQEAVSVRRCGDGSFAPRTERLTNGAWRGPNGFRMKKVSAAVIAFGLTPFTIHRQQPVLYHHPCPSKTVPREMWPLPQYFPDNNKMVPVQGKSVFDLFALPLGFPPEDE